MIKGPRRRQRRPLLLAARPATPESSNLDDEEEEEDEDDADDDDGGELEPQGNALATPDDEGTLDWELSVEALRDIARAQQAIVDVCGVP